MLKQLYSVLLRLSLSLIFGWHLFLTSAPALAVGDRLLPGVGNQTAIALSNKSPLVRSSTKLIIQQAGQIKNAKLQAETLDAVSNPTTCIRHRVGVDEGVKTTILQNLRQAGLIDPQSESSFPGGIQSGVFPPVLEDGSQCPQLPQTFSSAPGNFFGGHHSMPGGLVIHEIFNDLSGLNLAANYQRVYGHTERSGLPSVSATDVPPTATDIYINSDIITAAPLWHDWAKTIVYQWNADGTEFAELSFGGNGRTDNYGQAGDSRTPAHHLLGLAETMKRGLSPALAIAQASAHTTPSLGNEYKVVNWLRTAAIVAQIDPVATNYLYRDRQNHLRLPPLRKLGDLDLNAVGETNLLIEYALHNLSDADAVFTSPAISIEQAILKTLAPKFGYDPADTSRYNNGFRNPVLTYLSAERLLIIYGNRGLNGVEAEIQKLRQQAVI
jgi:hypothetical protein